jgi:hypothetical protein
MAKAAGGTNQRLKPALAMVRFFASKLDTAFTVAVARDSVSRDVGEP